ncbi:syntaxin-17-like [Paramacrobiotus metropolitanus]|uniref:syntaxin-17-like n=1 Tax=Paramacrobiotus metropolitanus TaxID=2943436 RepID=UPI0024460BE8|nr:syntaxin-17-like [Paramacrobiotus metropolitanus]
MRNNTPDLNPEKILNPLYAMERKRYILLLERFEQYSIKPHLEALKDHEKELDRLKLKKDRRNVLPQRMEASRVLQQIRVDLVDLNRIREQAQCPEDVRHFDENGERLRVQLLRTVASILEKHPEVKRPIQAQDDVLLNEEEKAQGYALASDELEREKDRIADQEDLLLRVETVHNEVEQVAGMMDQFWTILEAQGKTVDSIDKNIAEADIAVVDANYDLSLAAKYKAQMYPVAGAVIGGIIGGPVGLLTGIKFAMAATAAAGVFIGYKGGNVWRRRTLLQLPFESKPRDASDIPQVDETNIASG